MSWWLAGSIGLQLLQGGAQAQMIQAQSEGQQAIDELNAESLEFDAFEAEQLGYTQVARYQSVVDKTLATRKAVQASQDIDTNFGTARDVQDENKLNAYMNSLDMVTKAGNNARNLKRRASSVRLGSDMNAIVADANARGAETAGAVKGVSTLANYYIKREG